MKTSTKIFLILLAISLLLVAIVASEDIASMSKPLEFGNGVLHFSKYTRESGSFIDLLFNSTFGNSLSTYLSEHPNQTVVSVTADVDRYGGQTTGFYVVVKTKQTLQCTWMNSAGQCYNYTLVDNP